jgi:hypothetical protein
MADEAKAIAIVGTSSFHSNFEIEFHFSLGYLSYHLMFESLKDTPSNQIKIVMIEIMQTFHAVVLITSLNFVLFWYTLVMMSRQDGFSMYDE